VSALLLSYPLVAFLEEDHVDDIRLGVAAGCVVPCGEVQGAYRPGLKDAFVSRVEVADLGEYRAIEGDASETKAEEASKAGIQQKTPSIVLVTRIGLASNAYAALMRSARASTAAKPGPQ
jgi:hypothetical protein